GWPSMPGIRLPSGGAVVVVVAGTDEDVVAGSSSPGAPPEPSAAGPPVGGPPAESDGTVDDVAGDAAFRPGPSEHPVTTSSAPTAAREALAPRRPGRRRSAGATSPAAARLRPGPRAQFSCGPPGWRPTGRGWRCARPRRRSRSRPGSAQPG